MSLETMGSQVKTMKRLTILLGMVVVLWGGTAWAVCTGSNPTWTCSSWDDLKSLVEGPSITTGATVTLAAGTHTANASITVPSAKKITIQGAGTTCPISCTTIVNSNVTNLFNLQTSGSRITRFEMRFDNVCSGWGQGGGSIITASHTGWRVDHNKTSCSISGNKADFVYYSNRGCYAPSCALGGLIDSNNLTGAATFYAEGTSNAISQNNLAAMAVPFTYGDNNAVYIEDNVHTINGIFGHLFDKSYGGAYVLRFNEINKNGETGSAIEGHGLQHAAQTRGALRGEVYWNTGTITGTNGTSPGYFRSAAFIAFGNRMTTAGTAVNTIRFDHRRSPGGDGSPTCDGNQPYDSNEGPTAAPGWLCRDQIGAGYDSTPYDGSLPFPAQTKMPAYTWDNGSTTVYVVSGHTDIIKENRDWYNHSAITDKNIPQTTGVRSGLKVNLPQYCTAGVGYWVTDEGHWNSKTPGADGVLYKCTGNAWTPFYIPYPYPHPQRSGLTAPTGVTVK